MRPAPLLARTPTVLLAATLALAGLAACDPSSNAGFSSPYGSSAQPPAGNDAGSVDAASAAPEASAPSPAGPDGGSPVEAGPDVILTSSLDAGAPADAAAEADAAPPLTTLSLIDTNVNTIPLGEPVSGFDPIPEGATLDVAAVGSGLSIRANTTPAVVGSVLFALDGLTTHTENAAPYMLCGDDGVGNITPCPLTLGAHTLVVTQFSEGNLDGGASPPTTLHFTLVDTSSDAGTSDSGDGAVTIHL